MQKDIHTAAAPAQIKAEIYFGLMIPNPEPGAGRYVGHAEMAEFLRDEIAPLFPGFTVDTCEGYWKGEPEPSMRVTILLEDTGAARTNVRFIAERYKTQFCQEAVAYSFTACEFTLNCWPFGPVKAYHRPGKGY